MLRCKEQSRGLPQPVPVQRTKEWQKLLPGSCSSSAVLSTGLRMFIDVYVIDERSSALHDIEFVPAEGKLRYCSVLNVFDVSEFSISGVRVGVGGLSSWLSQATCWWNDQRKWNPPKIMESIEHYVWRWEQTGENLMTVTGHAVHEAANLWGEHPKSHENQIDRSPWHWGETYILLEKDSFCEGGYLPRREIYAWTSICNM